MTKFTSSVGKGKVNRRDMDRGLIARFIGLSAATFDSEYQTRRRMTQRRNRPRHAMYEISAIAYLNLLLTSCPLRYGVTAGGEALASSMASAVEGVVVSPKLI